MQNRKRGRAKVYNSDHLMFHSILGILLIAVGVLSVISVVGGVQGSTFTMVRGILQGMGGALCLGIPVFFLWGGGLVAFSAYHKSSVRAILFLFIFYLGALGIINLLSKVGTTPLLEYAVRYNQGLNPAVAKPDGYWEMIVASYQLCRGSSALGGAMGMLTAWPLWTYVGNTFGIVILSVLCLLCVLFFSKFDIVGVVRQARETSDQKMEQREIEQKKQQYLKQLEKQKAKEDKKGHRAEDPAATVSGAAMPPMPSVETQATGQSGAPNAPVAGYPYAPYPQSAIPKQNHMPPAMPASNGAMQPQTQPLAPELYDEMIVPEVPNGGTASNWKLKSMLGNRPDRAGKAPPPQAMQPVSPNPGVPDTRAQGDANGADKTATMSAAMSRDREINKLCERMEQNRKRKEEIEQRIAETQVGNADSNSSLTPAEKAMLDTRLSEVFLKQTARGVETATSAGGRQSRTAAKANPAQAIHPSQTAGVTPGVTGQAEGSSGRAAGTERSDNIGTMSQEQWAFANQVAAYRPPERAKAQAVNAPPDRFAAYRKPTPGATEPAMSGTPLDRAELKLPKKPSVAEPARPIEEKPYPYPMIELLNLQTQAMPDTRAQDRVSALKLEETLDSFSIPARVQHVTHGPAVTRFELGLVSSGINVKRIMNIADNIALDMAANGGVRIEVPIPGTNLFGVEVPNREIISVSLAEVLTSPEMTNAKSPLSVALGKDIAGRPIVCDLARMPHLLIAGQTGSGKSVCINAIINSLLYRSTPEEVRMIMIDPKVVELQGYNQVPHLLIPVVSDPHKAAGALAWAVQEMLDRYHKMQSKGVREISAYNAKVAGEEPKLPRIVIIIDELSDLMLACKKEVEESIIRLAQLARAAGIHMVVATQRPTVNVITGLIKANIPSRIAFAVASSIDSRTILDMNGAEKLLGKGDMFYFPTGEKAPLRVQGCFVSDSEINAVVDYIGKNSEPDYDERIHEIMDAPGPDEADSVTAGDGENDVDDRLQEAIEMVLADGQASISMLQRRMKIGYARAGRLVDDMAARGIISKSAGSKPREVLITFDQYLMGRDAQAR